MSLMMKQLFLLLLSVLITSSLYAATEDNTILASNNKDNSHTEIISREPRSFGLMLGDIIEQKIRLTLPPNQSLNINALPTIGMMNPWLELRAFTYQLISKTGATPATYEFHFTYQLFKQVSTPETLVIPATHLLLTSGTLIPLPTWSIRYTPLASEASITPLAAAQPALYDTSPLLLQSILATIALLLCLFIWLWLKGYLPFGRRCFGPFTQAERQLQQLAKQPNITAAQLLQHWQNALASSAGYYVFPDQLTQYFQEHPDYQTLQPATQQLLDQAHQARFSHQSTTIAFPSANAILQLAQQFSRQEQWQWKSS